MSEETALKLQFEARSVYKLQDCDPAKVQIHVTDGFVWCELVSDGDHTRARLQLDYNAFPSSNTWCSTFHCMAWLEARLSGWLMITGARLHSINLQLTRTGRSRRNTDKCTSTAAATSSNWNIIQNPKLLHTSLFGHWRTFIVVFSPFFGVGVTNLWVGFGDCPCFYLIDFSSGSDCIFERYSQALSVVYKRPLFVFKRQYV